MLVPKETRFFVQANIELKTPEKLLTQSLTKMQLLVTRPWTTVTVIHVHVGMAKPKSAYLQACMPNMRGLIADSSWAREK